MRRMTAHGSKREPKLIPENCTLRSCGVKTVPFPLFYYSPDLGKYRFFGLFQTPFSKISGPPELTKSTSRLSETRMLLKSLLSP